MKNLLLTVGAVAVAYALYRQWALKNDKDAVKSTTPETKKAIQNAKEKTMSFFRNDNAEVFRSMGREFNAEESATVAPSINAKIGIF